MYNFTLIGDSLTNRGFSVNNGWVKLLHNKYTKARIMNYGYEGYTSTMLKNMIKRLVPNSNIFLATILLGTNDCYSSSFVSPKQYKQNISYIIQHIHNLNPDCIILLITPPICKLNNYIFEYVEIIYQIGKEFSYIQIIDLHSGPNKILLEDLHDGVNFGEIANKKLCYNIEYTLQEKYGFDSFAHLK
jgi:lysophospholipase L1-like esterase